MKNVFGSTIGAARGVALTKDGKIVVAGHIGHEALTAVPALTSVALPSVAAAQTAMPDPLDDRSVKRLDKMEKVVRELRAIVFQGRDTGKPVVVQAAETDAQIAAMSERMRDLEQTLTKLNGQNEGLTTTWTRRAGPTRARRPAPTRWTSAWPPWKSASPTRKPRLPPPPPRPRSPPRPPRPIRTRPSSRPASCCWTATTAAPSRPSPAMSRPSPTAPRRRRPAIGWARPSSSAKPIPTPREAIWARCAAGRRPAGRPTRC